MYNHLLVPLMAVFRLLPMNLTASAVQRTPSATLPRANQGLQYGAVIDNTGHILLHDEALSLMAQAGAGWIRINFRLGIGSFLDWTETTTYGYSSLSLYDTIVDTARSRGLRVLGELSNEAWNGYLADWQANNAEVAGGTGDNPY